MKNIKRAEDFYTPTPGDKEYRSPRIRPQQGVDNYQQQLEVITAPEEIAIQLQNIFTEQLPLAVLLPDQRRPLASRIEAIHKYSRYLQLEGFYNPVDHESVKKGQAFKVRIRSGNIHLYFLSRVEEVSHHDGQLHYLLPFPERIFTTQRRKRHRLHLHEIVPVEVRLGDDEDELLYGVVNDISAAGLGILIEDEDHGYEILDHIATCRLFLPDDEIALPVEVRRICNDKEQRHGYCLIGARFITGNTREQDLLQRQVTRLERLLLRQRRR